MSQPLYIPLVRAKTRTEHNSTTERKNSSLLNRWVGFIIDTRSFPQRRRPPSLWQHEKRFLSCWFGGLTGTPSLLSIPRVPRVGGLLCREVKNRRLRSTWISSVGVRPPGDESELEGHGQCAGNIDESFPVLPDPTKSLLSSRKTPECRWFHLTFLGMMNSLVSFSVEFLVFLLTAGYHLLPLR